MPRTEPQPAEDDVDLTRLVSIDIPRYRDLTSFQLNELRRIMFRYPDARVLNITAVRALRVQVTPYSQVEIKRDPPPARPGLQILPSRPRR